MKEFSTLFLKSDFDYFFQDLYYFATKFVNTFGVVMEAQFFYCPYQYHHNGQARLGFNPLPSLALLVFILSLIPVASVIISAIPLRFIAY